MDVGIPVDSPNLVLLFYVAQLFLLELHKSKNLISIIPMDMSGYYGKLHVYVYNVSIMIYKLFKESADVCREMEQVHVECYYNFFFIQVRGR